MTRRRDAHPTTRPKKNGSSTQPKRLVLVAHKPTSGTLVWSDPDEIPIEEFGHPDTTREPDGSDDLPFVPGSRHLSHGKLVQSRKKKPGQSVPTWIKPVDWVGVDGEDAYEDEVEIK